MVLNQHKYRETIDNNLSLVRKGNIGKVEVRKK